MLKYSKHLTFIKILLFKWTWSLQLTNASKERNRKTQFLGTRSKELWPMADVVLHDQNLCNFWWVPNGLMNLENDWIWWLHECCRLDIASDYEHFELLWIYFYSLLLDIIFGLIRILLLYFKSKIWNITSNSILLLNWQLQKCYKLSLISDWTQSITTNTVYFVWQLVNGSQYHWNKYTPKLISILLFIELKGRIESTNGVFCFHCWKSCSQHGS